MNSSSSFYPLAMNLCREEDQEFGFTRMQICGSSKGGLEAVLRYLTAADRTTPIWVHRSYWWLCLLGPCSYKVPASYRKRYSEFPSMAWESEVQADHQIKYSREKTKKQPSKSDCIIKGTINKASVKELFHGVLWHFPLKSGSSNYRKG